MKGLVVIMISGWTLVGFGLLLLVCLVVYILFDTFKNNRNKNCTSDTKRYIYNVGNDGKQHFYYRTPDGDIIDLCGCNDDDSEDGDNHDTKSEHLFSVLKEALRHPAISVELKEEGTINLFFDGCCECDIQIKNYTDLRGEDLYDS